MLFKDKVKENGDDLASARSNLLKKQVSDFVQSSHTNQVIDFLSQLSYINWLKLLEYQQSI